MRGSDFQRRALSLGAVLVLAGCAGTAATLAPASPASWMAREASSGTLLYYSDGNATVYAIGYPGGKLMGMLTGIDGAMGVCSDMNGNLFVTTYTTETVLEYAHGGTQPIAKLPDYGYHPLGCAVDQVTGNLAVANTESMNYTPGNVAIYTGAKGKPTNYTAPGITNYDWVAYDDSGNLYVNGTALAEMPYGSQQFQGLSLSVTGAGIKWDGRYLAMVDPNSKVIYRLAISGSSAYVAKTVTFSGLFSRLGTDFAILSGKVVVPFGTGNRHLISGIGLWEYPKGGRLLRKIHKVRFIEDLTLSI